MLKTCDILDEKEKCLRAKNTDVEFPLSKEDKQLVLNWQNARVNKDFELADKLRDEITNKGIVL